MDDGDFIPHGDGDELQAIIAKTFRNFCDIIMYYEVRDVLGDVIAVFFNTSENEFVHGSKQQLRLECL